MNDINNLLLSETEGATPAEHLQARQKFVVPAGYALVPLEPTPAMIRAGSDSKGRSTVHLMENPRLIYIDMIAVAPKD